MSNNDSNQINWVKLLTEMSSIIFAVLLALWVESWMEEQDLKDQADAALIHITAEIKANNQDTKDAIKVNQQSIEGIRKLLNGDEINMKILAPFFSISAGSTSNSAWESAKMSPAMSIIPLEVVSELASIYDTQNYYTSYVNFVFQEVTNLSSNIIFDENAKQSAQKFAQHIAMINALATQLVESYDGYLDTKVTSTSQ